MLSGAEALICGLFDLVTVGLFDFVTLWDAERSRSIDLWTIDLVTVGLSDLVTLWDAERSRSIDLWTMGHFDFVTMGLCGMLSGAEASRNLDL